MTSDPRLQDSNQAALVSTRNNQTRQLETYASHRLRTMQLVIEATARLQQSGGRSISVLGAGNCMDLDLALLQSQFQTIHLLDLDRSAIEYGVQSQLGGGNQGHEQPATTIDLIAPFDLSSPLASLTCDCVASQEQIDSICRQLEGSFDCAPVEPSDVVLSTCVLSQIIGALLPLLPQEHPSFLPLLQCIRRGHFRRMLQLLKPGGQGIFVSDLVSSESATALHTVLDSQLPQLLAECIASCNFFSGLNPGVILQELHSADGLQAECHSIKIHAPWRWHMGQRIYAVFAITFTRS